MSITEGMAAIWIDPSRPNNRGDGTTLGSAWRDAGELTRRLGRGTSRFRQATTITIAGNLPASDPLMLKAASIPGASLRIQGTPTVDDSGTFGAPTAINRATHQMQQVVDVGQDFTPHAYKLIRIPTGARAGATTSIAKVLSPTSVRTGRWGIPQRADPSASAFTAPQNGDPYQILTLPTVHVGTLTFEPGSNDNGSYVNLHNLHLSFMDEAISPSSSGSIDSTGVVVSITGCTTEYLISESDFLYVVASRLHTPGTSSLLSFYHGSLTFLLGCVVHSTAFLDHATLDVDRDTLWQSVIHATAITHGSRIEIGTAAIFDSQSSGTINVNGGTLRTFPKADAVDLLWGNNNVGKVKVFSGGVMEWTTRPTVTPASGKQLIVGGTELDWADTPYTNIANGARCVQLT